jgi:hypothetical protein
MKNFFSNSGYATWFQSVIVVLSVLVAALAISSSDRQASVSNTITITQHYFTGTPALVEQASELRREQFNAVQEAKKKIPNYSTDADSTFAELFKVARPLVNSKIKNDDHLRKQYEAVEPYFILVVLCVNSGACSARVVNASLSEEIRAFYNAVCAYQEELERAQKNDRDSQLFVQFLTKTAGYTDLNRHYFCREKAAHYLNN